MTEDQEKRLKGIQCRASDPIPDELNGIDRDTAEAILEGTTFLLSIIDEQKKKIDRLEMERYRSDPIKPHEFGGH